VVSDVCVNGFEVVILWYVMYNVDSFVVSKSVVLIINTYSTVGTVVSDV